MSSQEDNFKEIEQKVRKYYENNNSISIGTEIDDIED